MKFTIFGATGFIGRELVNFLNSQGIDTFIPKRDFIPSKDENLGHVIYCIGLTSDFRKKPFQTVEAHVCKLKKIIMQCHFESFVYLSSTRVYNGSELGIESNKLVVNPNNFSDLYNISKIMGESICLSIHNKNVKVVRLSNVLGNDFSSGNIVYSLIEDAIQKGKISLKQSANVERDFISVDKVVSLIVDVAVKGLERIYNIASGQNVSNQVIIDNIQERTNCEVTYESENEVLKFPVISIEKIVNEFSFKPENFENKLNELILNYQSKQRDDTNR